MLGSLWSSLVPRLHVGSQLLSTLRLAKDGSAWPAKIRTMCGQAECTKLIHWSAWVQQACRIHLRLSLMAAIASSNIHCLLPVGTASPAGSRQWLSRTLCWWGNHANFLPATCGRKKEICTVYSLPEIKPPPPSLNSNSRASVSTRGPDI